MLNKKHNNQKLTHISKAALFLFLLKKPLRKFKPQKGDVLIWPGGFTHLHRGNPPTSGDKYICTGWYQGNIGLTQVQTAGLNDKQYMESMGN